MQACVSPSCHALPMTRAQASNVSSKPLATLLKRKRGAAMECEPLLAQASVNRHAQFAAGRIRDGERGMAAVVPASPAERIGAGKIRSLGRCGMHRAGGSWGGPQQTEGNPRQVSVQILTVPSRISWSVPSALFTRNDRLY